MLRAVSGVGTNRAAASGTDFVSLDLEVASAVRQCEAAARRKSRN